MVAWSLAVPLAVIGSQVAPVVGSRLVTPGEDERAHALTSSGHAYFTYLPLILAVCTALLVLGLIGELRRLVSDATQDASRPSAWGFAALAPAIFCFQEHFERLAHDGAFPFDAALERTFLVGLLLQVPFALAAFLLARMLLSAVRALVYLLSAQPRGRRAGSGKRWHLVARFLPRIPALARGYGSRGPPVLLAA
jgi:hypothetical protein